MSSLEAKRWPAVAALLLTLAAVALGVRETIEWRRLDAMSPQQLIEEADALLLDDRAGKAIELYLRAAERAARDPNGESVRDYAFAALASRVQHPSLIDALSERLESPIPVIRRSAAQTLGVLGDGEASARLVEAASDPVPEVAYAALEALQSVHQQRPNLVVNTYGDDPAVVGSLGEMLLLRADDPQASEATVRALESDHGGVRYTALVVLDVAIGAPAGHFDPDQLARVHVAVERSLRDDSRQSRQIAGRILTKLPVESSTEARIAALEGETDPSVRHELARTLGETARRDREGDRSLLDALNSEERHVRVTSAAALAGSREPGRVPALVHHLLARLGEGVRFSSRSDRGSSARRRVAQFDEDEQLLLSAIQNSDPARARSILEAALRPPLHSETVADLRRRRAAALLLETFADASSQGALIACLSDSDLEVQTHCIGALGILGLEEAIEPLLEHWLRQPETPHEVREEHLVDALHWALVEITGHARLGRDAQAWNDWWLRNRSYR